jgi:hypothetical protein
MCRPASKSFKGIVLPEFVEYWKHEETLPLPGAVPYKPSSARIFEPLHNHQFMFEYLITVGMLKVFPLITSTYVEIPHILQIWFPQVLVYFTARFYPHLLRFFPI